MVAQEISPEVLRDLDSFCFMVSPLMGLVEGNLEQRREKRVKQCLAISLIDRQVL